jgi:hypothetical protein
MNFGITEEMSDGGFVTFFIQIPEGAEKISKFNFCQQKWSLFTKNWFKSDT